MSSPRNRLVLTMARQIREHGVEGTGLRPVVAEAHAPWGSLRHYFPGGKDQLVTEALALSAAYAAGVITRYLDSDTPTPAGLVRTVVGWWIDDLERSDFAHGCPVAATIVDCAHTHPALRQAANEALEVWRSPLRVGLTRLGYPDQEADDLSVFILAALSGGILLSRARRSTEPLRIVQARLGVVLAPR